MAVELSYLVLWCVFATQCGVCLLLLRQVGALFVRTAAIIAQTTIAVGDLMPDLSVLGQSGELMRLRMAPPGTRPRLVLFVSPACPACKEIAGEISLLNEATGEDLELVVLAVGEPKRCSRFRNAYQLESIEFYATTGAPLRACGVRELPFAIRVTSQGVIEKRGTIETPTKLYEMGQIN